MEVIPYAYQNLPAAEAYFLAKKADTELFPYRLFSVVPPLLVVSKCALSGRLYKPPSRREPLVVSPYVAVISLDKTVL